MKKLFLSLLTLLYSYTLILSPIHAQSPSPGPWWDQSFSQFSDKVKNSPPNEIFGERYTVAQINWIVNGLAYLAISPITDPEFFNALDTILKGINLGSSNKLAEKNQLIEQGSKMGPIGLMGIIFAESYSTPPSSGVQYLASSLNGLQMIPSAYAQGFGFQSLTGVQKLWTASRNISMAIVAIIMVASGFMIMFKVKINPQTVISIQTLIPKLITTLILIFFSYAIAGLVIDFVYVILGFFLGTMHAAQALTSNLGAQGLINWFTAPTPALMFFYFLFPMTLVGLALYILPALLSAGAFFAPPLGIIAGGAWSIATLIIVFWFLWILWLLVQILWMMTKSYISLMIYIILGPWYIMMGLIPGQKGFSDWLKTIIAEASVFVVIPLMLALNMVFWQFPRQMYDMILISGVTYLKLPESVISLLNTMFNVLAPITTSSAVTEQTPSLPLFGSGNGFLFQIVLGYMILALMPKAAKMVKDAIGVKEFAYMSAFGEADPTKEPINYMARKKDAQYERELKRAEDPANAGKYTDAQKEALRFKQDLSRRVQRK